MPIRVATWSPLMQAGAVLRDPALIRIAARHRPDGRAGDPALERAKRGVVTIPKSVTLCRIGENAGILDFALGAENMAAIAVLDRGERCGPDPLNFNF